MIAQAGTKPESFLVFVYFLSWATRLLHLPFKIISLCVLKSFFLSWLKVQTIQKKSVPGFLESRNGLSLLCFASTLEPNVWKEDFLWRKRQQQTSPKDIFFWGSDFWSRSETPYAAITWAIYLSWQFTNIGVIVSYTSRSLKPVFFNRLSHSSVVLSIDLLLNFFE